MGKRTKVLFITTQVVVPPDDGGKQGIYYRLQRLTNFIDLEVVMFNIARKPNLQELCQKYLPGIRVRIIEPFHSDIKTGGIWQRMSAALRWLFSGRCRWADILHSKKLKQDITAEVISRGFAAVVLEIPFAAELIDFLILKENGVRIVTVEHNVEYQYILDSLNLPTYLLQYEARRIYQYEKSVLQASDVVLGISPQDILTLKNKFSLKNAYYLPSVLPLAEKKWAQNDSEYIIFCGSLAFPPNFEGVQWFLENVFKTYLEHYPTMKFKITGKVNPVLQERLGRCKQVEFTGFLSAIDLEELMINARFAVVPIRKGSGVKVKLLEALAHGMPVITTAECYAGAPYGDAEEVPYIFAHTAEEYLEAMYRLTEQPAYCAELGACAYSFFAENYASEENVKNWRKKILGEYL